MSAMRAYELRGPSLAQLALVERALPRPSRGQALLKLRAVALNARDVQIVAGRYPLSRGFPLVPVSDGVGEVMAVGDGVTRVAVGERVGAICAQRWLSGPRDPETWTSTLGADLDGLLQEYVVLDEAGLVSIPAHLSDQEAATLPTAGVTAWQALVTEGRVRPGDYVLVQGTGGVALFALEFARMLGANVIVTSADREKLARARELGAVGALLRTDADWVRGVRELSGGRGVDHVVDLSADLPSALACLRIGGVISQIGYFSQTELRVDVFSFLLANAHLHGISVGPRSTFEHMNGKIHEFCMRPVVGRTFQFENARDAFAYAASGSGFGKTVVVF